MNREIKFRQPLRNKKGNFIEWFYWDLFISPAIQQNGLDTRKESQQFTGLTDKNGKEIYEGDVVRVGNYFNAHVIWSESVNGWQYKYKSVNGWCRDYLTDTSQYENIGNIFENPELLKQ